MPAAVQIGRVVLDQPFYGVPMAAGSLAATSIVVEAWVVLVAAASIVVAFVGTGLTITYHLAGRIDHQGALLGGRIDHVAGELVLVRERVARVEVLFSDRRHPSDPSSEPPLAGA